MFGLLSAILPTIFSTVDKAVLDKDKAAELKNAIQSQLIEVNAKQLDAATKVIVADAQGASWMQRNWRPSFMYAFLFIVVNNFIVYPYVSIFTDKAVAIEIPDLLWNFMMAVGGLYTLGRSGEKIVEGWKKPQS